MEDSVSSWGYPQFSSTLKWDFPRQKPSIVGVSPMAMETPIYGLGMMRLENEFLKLVPLIRDDYLINWSIVTIGDWRTW